MIKENTDDDLKLFLDLDNNGHYIKVDLTFPLQMLFDDVINFVSTTFD